MHCNATQRNAASNNLFHPLHFPTIYLAHALCLL